MMWVLQVGVRAMKTHPSVKLALVVHEVKAKLSNVTNPPRAEPVLHVKHNWRNQLRKVIMRALSASPSLLMCF